MSIGLPEVSVAAFVYSFIIEHDVDLESISSKWIELRGNPNLNMLNEKMLLSLIICRICFDAIRSDLMNNNENRNLKEMANQFIKIWDSIP